MQADLLAQLRDIHLPADPEWWPPAPGWWILALIAGVVLVYGVWRLIARWQRFRPARQAQALYLDVYAAYTHGGMRTDQYLHRTNEVLKRFVIYGIGHTAAKPESATRQPNPNPARVGCAILTNAMAKPRSPKDRVAG